MRRRRAIVLLTSATIAIALLAGAMPKMIETSLPVTSQVPAGEVQVPLQPGSAAEALEKLEVKGRAPKTGYERSQFGNGWAKVNGCSVRDVILYRDLENPVLEGECTVKSGTLHDPYTGTSILFSRSESSKVQIDHVVALSDAWQKGAQQLTIEQRKQLANDPLELLAVDGAANQNKSDGDAATWLPSKKSFRCTYAARQVAVKSKYSLWVTEAEKNTLREIFATCPGQSLP